MRAVALVLFLAAGSSAAGRAAGGPPAAGTLAEWSRDLDRAMSETDARLGELTVLSERYRASVKDPGLARERDELRADVGRRRQGVAARQGEGRPLADRDGLGLPPAAGLGTRLRGALPPDMVVLMDAARTRSAVVPFLRRVDQALDSDAAAWRSAADSARQRRLLGAVIPGLGAAVVLAGALFLGSGRGTSPALGAPPPPAPTPPAPARPPADLAPGAIVGGSYLIVRPLGSDALGTSYVAAAGAGSFAVVTRVRDEIHRRDAELFLAEARRAAALRHPYLAEVLSVFIEGDRIYVAAELVTGRSLPQMLASRGPLGLAEIKNVVSSVAAVLDHAHENGLRHGNLRPADILIREDGAVKVKDLGLALAARRILAGSAAPPPVDLAYMAPEEELGAGMPASDVYSLGAVLYEMAAGRPPFPGPDFLAQKRAMRWPPVAAGAAGLPAGLDAVLEKALSADPARRYPTASELFGALVDL